MKFSFNMLYFIKKQYFKTQLINTEHRTQDTDTGLRTQTHAKNYQSQFFQKPFYIWVFSFLWIVLSKLDVC